MLPITMFTAFYIYYVSSNMMPRAQKSLGTLGVFNIHIHLYYIRHTQVYI